MSVMGMSRYEDGFRLAGPPSECSLRSKARIDALFEDSKSLCSSTFGAWYAGVSTMASANRDAEGIDEQKRVNSAVQARIEAMFASVEAESGTPGECAAAILPVKYMGAAPVGGRVASVKGLQEPLRQLLERVEGSVRAELEVSRRGLTFRTSEICEKNNPFRRIAVWSALRLHCRRTTTGDLHHAFLPLVGDQDQGQAGEDKHADLYRTMRGLKSDVNQYPPIFAVVMRRPGAARLLECHAFACDAEEDAVAAAATLYRALLADMDTNRRRPRHTNGVGCISLASIASSVREQSPNNRSMYLPPAAKASIAPVRPPRVKKNSMSSSMTEDDTASKSPVELQKAPRRKKKNSDIKAEDILEARGKRRSEIKIEKSPVPTSDSSQKNYETVTSRNEEWQNNRNMIASGTDPNFSSKVVDVIVERPASRLDKTHDARNGSAVYEARSNKYEKLPVIKNKCDQEICPKIFSVVGRDEAIESKEEIYDKNHGSYDLHGNETVDEVRQHRQTYSTRRDAVQIYDRVERLSCRSQENSIYGQTSRRSVREKVYEERLKDAERIYGQQDLYSRRSRIDSQTRRSQENIFFAKTISSARCLEHRDDLGKRERQSRDTEKSQSGRRLSRVVTMDPLKKPGTIEDVSSGEKVPEYSQPRVRKRSRAGSEPPVSRSEDASKILQESRLKRSQSDLEVDRGDLMTRVELPRRGSFLKTGSTKRPNNITGGTPLGFTELFDEFRNQEGLTSVDDILAAIIDPEGMSFNDLKPLYKEFLLKLAATLTQDELYQRSASIMRRRRRPQRRRSTRRPCLLGRAIKRSVSRLKGGPTEFTSVIFPARRLNDSFGSSSSCDAKNSHRNRVLGSRLGRKRSSWRINKTGQCHTTSEDSDTCRRLSRSVGAGANRSSSGYVSCSECSYDSESCTCVSADKCYCSLSRRVPAVPFPGNSVVCVCDTDSCSESNKCYCARKPAQSTILEQLRQRGIVPSESTLSRGGSPDRVKTTKNSGIHTPRAVEAVKSRTSPPCGSSDNLALDYDLFSPGRKSQQSSGSEKVLVVSARDTQGRLVYVGGAEREKKCYSHASVRSGAHHEALSIKKSAEIAAIFGADSNRMSRRTSNASSIRSSISLEAGLGYLP